MVQFNCPGCGRRLTVQEALAGRKVRCPNCGAITQAAMPAGHAHAGRSGSSAGGQTSGATSGSGPISPAQAIPRAADSSSNAGPTEVPGPGGPGGLDLARLLGPAQQPGELGRLGSYRVLRVLGGGAMGVVFLAEDIHLARPVALKVMQPALIANAEARARFLREARLAASLQHDHIVTVYQVGEDRGIPFLAMQLLEGETLEDRLRREPMLPLQMVLRLGREVAEGLAAAHARGLIHRDIKPSNLWLETGRERVKILDFGLARAAQEDARVSQSGAIIGTPAYMAPEQARGHVVGTRADLFSLGCVLYRLGTGRLPFVGKDTLAVLSALAVEDPTPAIQFNPSLPPALSDLVMWLLCKDPAARPGSARNVVETLTQIEQGLLSAATLVLPSGGVPSLPVAHVTETEVPEVIVLPDPGRRRLAAIALDVAALLVLGSGIFFLARSLGGRGESRPPASASTSAAQPR